MSVARTAALALVVLAALVPPAPGAGAAPSKDEAKKRQQQIERELRRLQDDVEEASEEESKLLEQLVEVRSRRQVLDSQVAATDRRIAGVRRTLAAAEADLRAAEAALRTAEGQLAAAEAELAGARSALTDRAVAAYVNRPELEVAGVVLGTGDLRTAVARVGYLQQVVQVQQREVQRVSELRDDTVARKATLAEQRAASVAARDVVKRSEAELSAARAEQDRIRDAVAADEAEEQRLLEGVRAQKATFEARIADLKKESDAVADLLRKLQAGQGTPAGGKGILANPVPGARLSSPYGPRTHPITGASRLHAGVDFAASSGTPIRAAADGLVIGSGWRGGYGNTVVIDHGSSLATLYAHQSQLLVSTGQQVKRGQVIGRVGSTGFSTGPHLHFEVRVSGTPVDPLRYL